MTRTTLVIMGAGGDLTDRLLLPGLGSWLKRGDTESITVIGAGRHGMADTDWQQRVADALHRGELDADHARSIAQKAQWQTVDVSEAQQWRQFLEGLPSDTALYLALPPAVIMDAIRGLYGASLPRNLRVAVEKPFGHDQKSAAELNQVLQQLLPDEQIFRVDHFLGFAAARSLLPFRYGSSLLEAVWTSTEVESIDIIFEETIALEGRADFYETTGALEDMLQSHLLLLLALAIMKEPDSMAAEDVQACMLEALRSVELDGEPATATRRAQYTAGNGVPGYREEDGVHDESTVETLAELKLRLNDPRWSSTKVRLRSGKALAEDASFIRFRFRAPTHQVQGVSARPVTEIDFGLGDPTVHLRLATQANVDGFQFAPVDLSGELDTGGVTPYGRVVGDFLTDGKLLAVGGATAEECWRIIDPVVAAWQAGEVALDTYEAGSSVPGSWD